MARPKKCETGADVKGRLEDALVDLLQEEPIERISVGQLVGRAGCSRGAFYYHYEDIYDLFDSTVSRYTPIDMVGQLIGLLTSSYPTNAGKFGEAAKANVLMHRDEILKINLLLGSKAGDRAKLAIKDQVMGIWMKSLGKTELDGETRIVFEFVFNGVTGVLAHLAHSGSSEDFADVVKLLTPEVPSAFVACLAKSGAIRISPSL